MGRGVAPAEPEADVGLGGVGAELGGVDRIGADLVEVGARQRRARGLGDPAPVGIAAVEGGLDQRRVGDRPRDPLGLAPGRRRR